MSPRAFAAIVGSALVVIGFVLLGLVGVTATGDSTNPYSGLSSTGTWECGTVFTPDRPVEPLKWMPEQEKACSEAFSDRAPWGWSLAGLGLIVGLGSAVVRPASRRSGEPVVNSGSEVGQPGSPS